MDNRMQEAMAEATRLTRAGRLAEANALIQQALQGASPTNSTTVTPTDTIIDADPHIVKDTPLKAMGAAKITPFGKNLPSSPRGVPFKAPATIPFPGGIPGKQGFTNWPTGREQSALIDQVDRMSGQFVDGVYTAALGKRTYTLYIPSGFTGQPLPLLIMLHGCTQSSVDFARGTRMNELAEKELCFVAYPEQAQPANTSKCWNWFQPANQQRDNGEPALIAGITRQIMSKYPVDASRVYVAGLSSGGAMAAIMAATYPDLYAAVGVHSGIAYGAAQDLPSAFKVMQQGATGAVRSLPKAIPIIVFHGDRDTTVSPRNADRTLEQWLQASPDSKRSLRESSGQVTGGHAYTRRMYTNAAGLVLAEEWIIKQAGHAWSGGSSSGTYTDPQGPDASTEMMRFFAAHPKKLP